MEYKYFTYGTKVVVRKSIFKNGIELLDRTGFVVSKNRKINGMVKVLFTELEVTYTFHYTDLTILK